MDYKHCDGCGRASADASEYMRWVQVLDQSAEPPLPDGVGAMLAALRAAKRQPTGFYEFCSWRCVATAALVKGMEVE